MKDLQLGLISLYLGLVLLVYRLLNIVWRGVTNTVKIFGGISSAHKRIDEQEKRVQEYVTLLDVRFTEVRREIKEIYQFIIEAVNKK